MFRVIEGESKWSSTNMRRDKGGSDWPRDRCSASGRSQACPAQNTQTTNVKESKEPN